MRNLARLIPVALLSTIVAVGALAPLPLSAGEDADLEKMIGSAKTAADHEAIAAVYEKQAGEATAAAAKHTAMGGEYKKLGGALIEKQHIDAHCAKLANLYKRVAKENEAIAAAHKAMAKEAK